MTIRSNLIQFANLTRDGELVLNENRPILPKELTSAILNLFEDYTKQQMEVSVMLLYSKSQAKWIGVVPKQTVTKVSVDSVPDIGIDILTGKARRPVFSSSFPIVGSIHSHNTMPAFFSSTDDAGELHTPGVHIVVGNQLRINKPDPDILCSIVINGDRYLPIEPTALAEDWSYRETPYHVNVHRVVTTIEWDDSMFAQETDTDEEEYLDDLTLEEQQALLEAFYQDVEL